MLPTIVGVYAGTAINFAALYKASPIIAPLLIFGAMIGALFVVSALRNSGWGVAAVFGFTFIAGMMLAPMLQLAAGLPNGGQLVALAGRPPAGRFFCLSPTPPVMNSPFIIPPTIPLS